MKELVFATGNAGKVREVAALLGGRLKIKSLRDIGCGEDLPETNPTLEENALQKARYVYEHFALDCFAEDTGLEVAALGCEPGVLSARYAGPARDPEANMDLLLARLAGSNDRRARFRTVVALILDGKEHLFEGIVNGRIAPERRGGEGFGYDPVFIPEGHDRSFAEMTAAEKNAVSHRGRAIARLVAFLSRNF